MNPSQDATTIRHSLPRLPPGRMPGMDDARTKHGPWFWGKVAIVAIAIYVGSFVALLGLDARLMSRGQTGTLQTIYAPIIWIIKTLRGGP